ncbi:MAG: C/D box methylation guide ribonucleoprotein complex aNOP56 subunit, partial [candidate division WOR-3 bacterium]
GKIARLLAGKIAIAAKIDYFTKEDKSAILVQDLKKHLEEIKQKFASPPKKGMTKKKYSSQKDAQDQHKQQRRLKKKFKKKASKNSEKGAE